jgi:enoyl-CoA hydratase/carnithine racemase
VTPLSLDELATALVDPQPGAGLTPPTGGGAVVVALDGDARVDVAHLRALVAVLIAIGPSGHRLAAAFDVVVDSEPAADEVVNAVARNPLAATSLALLLRATEELPVADALVVESATYSLLQAGPEHKVWLAGRGLRITRPDAGPPVRLERRGNDLHLTLDRPQVRNAFNAATRDGLLDGLAVAAADQSIAGVVVSGEGLCFCSGGDLSEFGTAADPASAHVLRVARSVGRAVYELRDRVQFVMHGPCVGAGVELPAFAGRVVARPDTTFRLPEVAMGMVPGAGGTVSLPRRIGRQRTGWLALTGATIDAATALDWGLVDAIKNEGSRW